VVDAARGAEGTAGRERGVRRGVWSPRPARDVLDQDEKDTATYTTQLVLVPDPRPRTRRPSVSGADLALKMQGTLGDMTFAVERMNSVRQALDERAGKLPASDAVAKRLRAASGRGCVAQEDRGHQRGRDDHR